MKFKIKKLKNTKFIILVKILFLKMSFCSVVYLHYKNAYLK